MRSLPTSLRWIFWDADIEVVDADIHADYVINRVLELGDFPELRWLLKQYGRDKIGEVVRTSRRISPKTANWWRLILDIPVEEVECLRTSSRRRAAGF